MTDHYPKEITFEFERIQLRRYLRWKYWLSWTLGLGFFGGLFGWCVGAQIYESSNSEGFYQAILCIILGILGGVACSLVLSSLLYFIFSHTVAGRMAESVELKVEGAFLRVIFKSFGTIDRKIHFRSILDYAVVQGPIMKRFGIHGLILNIPSPPAVGLQFICGLKDCEKVRDMLAEIDSQRENG